MGILNKLKKKKSTDLHKCLAKEENDLNNKLKSQEDQLKSILDAEQRFKDTGDIGGLIEFWETIWSDGGLIFNGSKWTFRLPDLYIQIQEYDNATRILNKINNQTYEAKKNSYLDRVAKLKTKHQTN